MKIAFFVARDGLTCKYLVLCRLVLDHILFDTRTLMDRDCLALGGLNCAGMGGPITSSFVTSILTKDAESTLFRLHKYS